MFLNVWKTDPRTILFKNCCLHPQVLSNGRPCILFQARKLSLRYERQKQLDLTERAFSPQKAVDISKSACSQDKATYVSQKRQTHLVLYRLCAENGSFHLIFLTIFVFVCPSVSPRLVMRFGDVEDLRGLFIRYAFLKILIYFLARFMNPAEL